MLQVFLGKRSALEVTGFFQKRRYILLKISFSLTPSLAKTKAEKRFNPLNLAKIVCLAKWVKEAKCVSSDFLNEKLLMILTCIILKIKAHLNQLVSDKNSWDTLAKCCFFPSRAPLIPLKVVYRGLVTKSCIPTLRGQGDPKVSQPF